MPDLSFLGLVPQIYIIWRWLAAAPLLLIASLIALIPILAFFQFGTADDWIRF